jgi:hypothetical protein
MDGVERDARELDFEEVKLPFQSHLADPFDPSPEARTPGGCGDNPRVEF